MMSPAAEESAMESHKGENTPSQPMSSLEVEQPLPSVAEITGRPEQDEVPRRRSYSSLIPVLVILVVVLLSLTIGLALGLKGEEESKEIAIEAAEQQEEVESVLDMSQRYSEIVRFVSDSEVSDLAALETDGSPQQLAATFMAMLDPLLLEIPHSYVIREGYQFVTRYVLMVLYFSTSGDEWMKQRHFKSELPTCQWWELNFDGGTSHLYEYTGVICNENGIITSLLLPEAKMQGSLPSELGLLFTLKSIVFNKNRLSGVLPSSFERLINLQDLWVADNDITGAIPSWIERFVGLRSLDVSHNRMASTLPAELGSLQYLEMLALDNNFFSGEVTFIFNLKSNKYGGLKKLKYLYLEGNSFSGEIGDDFMYLEGSQDTTPPLVALDLSYNSFTGTLPSHLFSSFSNLKVFDANNCVLTGRLPQNILPNESLEFLALHGNQLTGEVSGLLPDLQRLTHLDVSSNQFTSWHIDLGALRDLSYLFLANNPFEEGAIPEFLNTLTNLQELSLKSTQRTGTIPAFLSKMEKLVLLDLDNNKSTGTIPVDLGSLSSLQFLLLNRNRLTGSVPPQFGALTALRLLFLDGNDLTGDLAPLCSVRDPFVVADCEGDDAPVSCSCCNKCCRKNEACNDETFIPNHGSVWQEGYQRFEYRFGSSDSFFEISATP